MKKKKSKSLIQKILFVFHYAFKQNKAVLYIFFLQIIFQLLATLLPIFFTALIFNALQNAVEYKWIALYIVSMFAGIALLSIATRILDNSTELLSDQLQKSITLDLGNAAMSMDYATFEKAETLNLLSSAGDMKNILGVFTSIRTILLNLLTVISLLGIICTLQPLLILFVIISVVSRIYCDNVSINSFIQWRDKLVPLLRFREYLSKISIFNLAIGKEVRINNASDWLLDKYTESSNQIDDIAIKRNIEYQKNLVIPEAADIIQECGMYLYLAYVVFRHGMEIGTFTLFLSSIRTFSSNLSTISSNIINFKYYNTFIDEFSRCIQLCQLKEPFVKKEGYDQIEDTAIKLVFHNVCFHYPMYDDLILKNISMEINFPEKIAIVGLNGAGKTTLIKLICRLYTPTQGYITLNGININEINLEQYYSMLSIMFQDYQLLPFRLADNIAYGENTDREKMEQVIQKVGLKERVAQMPQKENTYLTSQFDAKGQDLSGGEKQKLIMARSLYRDTKIVIMDEPTAALDALAEHRLYMDLNDLVKDRICIFISHRLASTRFCDRILVLADGYLEQEGTHDELLGVQGTYSALWQMQSKYYKRNEVTESI